MTWALEENAFRKPELKKHENLGKKKKKCQKNYKFFSKKSWIKKE
jgi:hypothetical protein